MSKLQENLQTIATAHLRGQKFKVGDIWYVFVGDQLKREQMHCGEISLWDCSRAEFAAILYAWEIEVEDLPGLDQIY